jgi:hypothetical protein
LNKTEWSNVTQKVNGIQQQQPSLSFQASWGRLEMKSHESKKQGQNKSEKGGKQRAIKNQIEKGEETIKR